MGGNKGAAGENVAAACFVRDFDALTRAGEKDGMITYDVAAAQGRKADLAGFSRAGMAVTGFDPDVVQANTTPASCGVTERERSA